VADAKTFHAQILMDAPGYSFAFQHPNPTANANEPYDGADPPSGPIASDAARDGRQSRAAGIRASSVRQRIALPPPP
jgi:hypothetical protein